MKFQIKVVKNVKFIHLVCIHKNNFLPWQVSHDEDAQLYHKMISQPIYFLQTVQSLPFLVCEYEAKKK